MTDNRIRWESLIRFAFATLAESGLLDLPKRERNEAKKMGELELLRFLLSDLLKKAGKSKDEILAVVAKEVGKAVAAMMEKPLQQILKNHKIQVSIEFVPRTPASKSDDLDLKGSPQIILSSKKSRVMKSKVKSTRVNRNLSVNNT